MPDCARCGSGLEETAEHTFNYCERVRPFWDHVGEWTAQLVLLDVSYVVDNVLPPFQGEKRVVFLAILAVARMVIWTMRKKGLYDDANFSHRDLVLYFRHQLRVKIRCDRKRLDWITFDKRWVNAAMLESSFPPLPAQKKSYIILEVLNRSFSKQMWYFGACSAHGDIWLSIHCTVKWVGECG